MQQALFHLEVTFVPEAGQPMVSVEPGVLAGVNPLYSHLIPSSTHDGKYILGVSNGRNLQNLNILAPTVAKSVENVVFLDDINWNDTVSYYNRKAPGSGPYKSSGDEAPGRCLPYFVPIHHEDLFGTARFIYPGDNDGGLGSLIEHILGNVFPNKKSRVPLLTDALDQKLHAPHAAIQGNGRQVSFLNIDSTRYKAPASGRFYATGPNQVHDYYFTGLFGYVNTTVDNLSVVNPIIKGRDFENTTQKVPQYSGSIFDITWSPELGLHFPIVGEKAVSVPSNPATGGLIGAGGYNTLVTNCKVFLDPQMEGFSHEKMGQNGFDPNTPQNWYGVSGAGAVGGLMGYGKCHRTVTADLDGNLAHLAFSRSLSAVPVSGKLRTYSDFSSTHKHFGYSNGVGGFIGNSQLTNFFDCYSSGNVITTGGLVDRTTLQSFIPNDLFQILGDLFGYNIELSYNGRTSFGSGGFVGTSHGTRYTNCFATGSVHANSPYPSDNVYGVGGFVGIMSYEETKKYGFDEGLSGNTGDRKFRFDQCTVFDSCYSVGGAYVGSRLQENFSGANARIGITLKDLEASIFAGDYYRLLAPYYVESNGSNPEYAHFYIFKDSYYLSKEKVDSINDNSNECANVASYDTLTDLVRKQRSSDWQTSQLTQVKRLPCYIRLSSFPVAKVDYDLKYFHHYDFDWKQGNFVPTEERPGVEDAYRRHYSEGFPGSHWSNPGPGQTHAYSPALMGSTYPFTKLSGLDYYGNWPSRPLSAGLAYYEIYDDGSVDGARGIYFDRDNTASEKLRNDLPIREDGYAILAGNRSDKVTLTVDGHSVTLNADIAEYKPGGDYNAAFAVFRIPQEYLKADPDSFYTRLQVTIKPRNSSKGNYTFYYNPNMALTQVNPAAGSKTASRPTAVPSQIQIRTARQFRALGTMENFWGADYHYYQTLDVDASIYRWKDGESIPVHTQPIGNAAHPFNGSYTSALDKPAAVRGFLPSGKDADIGFFGRIGENGSIRHLVLDLRDQTGTAAAGSKAAENAGLLAGSCAGTLEDIGILLPEPSENAGVSDFTLNVEAKTSAGLLAGTASGTVRDCHVQGGSNTALSVSADRAGAVLGLASGNTVSASDLTLAGSLTLSGRQAGGFAGAGTKTSFDTVNVTLDGALTVNAEQAGGLNGALEGSELRSCEVKLNSTTDGGKSVFGGLAGSADTVKAVAVRTVIHGRVGARQAAGLVGTAPGGLSVINSTVTLEAELHGTERSVGAVGDLGAGSDLSTLTVDLSRGKLTSDAAAAGFAGTVSGRISGSRVLLGSRAGVARISGKEAAGFVLTVDGGEVSHGSVSGSGRLKGSDRAAGFVLTVTGENGRVAASFVTPVQGDDSYLGKSTRNLTISGGTVSGFAGEVSTSTADESGAGLYNCWTLCHLNGTASGFAASNAGKINGCTANVSMDAGNAFVGTSTGLVANSYGWFAGSAALPADEAVGYRSCYFADLDPVKDQRSMVLFDKDTKAVPDMNAAKLAASLENLRGPDGRWYVPETFVSHPFDPMDPPNYPFPMLRDHYGNWLPAPHCAYGVAYYELYDGAQTLAEPGIPAPVAWMHLVDLSPVENSVESDSLSGSWSFDAQWNFTAADHAPVAPITDAGYVLFCKKGLRPPFEPDLMGSESVALAAAPIPNALETYTFYDLKADGKVEIAVKDNSLQVVTWFADELQDDGKYAIRTPGQFANLGKASSAKFTQERDLTADSFETVADFSGSYNGSGHQLVLTGTAPWITTLSGTVTDLNLTASAPLIGTLSQSSTLDAGLTVTGAITAPVLGTADGTVRLNVLKLDDNVTVEQDGALVSALNGSFTAPAITLGQVKGNVFGTLGQDSTLSLDSLTAGAVSGSLFGTVNGSVSDLVLTVTGPVSAPLFGEVGGPVTLSALNLGETVTLEQGGALVKTLSGSFSAPGFTLGEVSGNVFDTVSGPLDITGPVTLGNVSGHFIGTVGADVALPSIQAGVLSGSLLETVNAAVTGSTLTSAEITAPVVNTLTHSLSGLSIEAGALKSNVVGNAKNATVSSITVNAKDQELTSPLIGSMAASRLNGLNLSCGTLNSNVIGTLSAGSLNGIHVTADKASVTGGVLAADAGSAAITGCTVSIPAIQGSGSPFGILTGNSSGEINNCTVTDTVLTAGSGVIGGLVGQSSGTLSGSEAAVTMNLTGAEATTAGGLAGVASSVSGCSVQAHITYLQPGSGDTAVIGGILGRMDSGSMENITAKGSIRLAAPSAAEGEPPVAGSGTGRSYTVGGALGRDGSGITCTGVTTSVSVGTEWASPGAVSASDPAGQGPVAMFVGEVKDGSFTNCASTADNTIYQFLGQIAVDEQSSEAMYRNDAPSAQTGFTVPVTRGETAALEQLAADIAASGYPENAETVTYAVYTATLDNCRFQLSGQTCFQVFLEDAHYYSKSEPEKDLTHTADEVKATPIEVSDNPTFKSLGTANCDKRPTDYFCSVDGSYHRLYLTIANKYIFPEWPKYYTLSYIQNNSGWTEFSKVLVRNSDRWGDPLVNEPWPGITLYTIPLVEPTPDRSYAIQDGGLACSLNNAGTLEWKALDPFDERMLWILSKGNGEGTWSWKNKADNTKFLGNDLNSVSDSAVNMSIKLADNPNRGFHIGTFEKPLHMTLIDVTSNTISVTFTPALTIKKLGYQPADAVTPPADPTVPADPADPQVPEVQMDVPSDPAADSASDPTGVPAANDPLPTGDGGDNP